MSCNARVLPYKAIDSTKKYDEIFNVDRKKPIATLLGYPSHWKDTTQIIKLIDKYNQVVEEKFKEKENELLSI